MSGAAFDPYQAPSAPLEDPQAPSGQPLVQASVSARFLARVLDALIIGLPALAMSRGLRSLLGMGTFRSLAQEPLARALGSCLGFASFVVVFLAVNGCLLARKGQTVGKLLCGIRIVRLDGSLPGLGELFVRRELALNIVSVLGSYFTLWAVYVVRPVDALGIFGARQRCLHDWLAGTRVVQA